MFARDVNAAHTGVRTARARLHENEYVGCGRVALRARAGEVGGRFDCHREHAGSRQALLQLPDSALPMRGMEAAVDVHHQAIRILTQGARDRIGHRVVPEVLAVEKAACGAAHPERAVPERRLFDALPVLGRIFDQTIRHQRAFFRRERVEHFLAAAREFPAQCRGQVGSDHRQPRLARELHHRPIVGAIVRPRSRADEKRRFADLAAQVRVELRLHVALEHLERQRRPTTARARQRAQQSELGFVRQSVEMALAEEHGIGACQSEYCRVPADLHSAAAVEDAGGAQQQGVIVGDLEDAARRGDAGEAEQRERGDASRETKHPRILGAQCE